MQINSFSLSDQTALVTGATSGIGRAIAIGLAQADAKVIVVGRNKQALEAIDRLALQNNLAIHSICWDLLDAQSLAALVVQAVAVYGDLSILVNAAGVNLREPAADISIESWNLTVKLNLSVPFFLAREIVPFMKKNNAGKIINIASLQSRRAFANSMAYGASKGGVDQLTRAMAQEWSPYGICCNAIAPGFFPTALTAQLFEDKAKRALLAHQTALGRNGELDDLIGPAVFLASKASDYITGQTLFVDGGFSAQ